MLKSMTGFGRAEVSDGNRKVTVEMKSVNQRYLDFNVKMPKKLIFFESSIRSLLKEKMQRGKVDVYITCEDLSEGAATVKYNRALAAGYLGHLREMAKEFGLEDDISASVLSGYPDVFTMEEQSPDEEELWAALSRALTLAANQLVEARAAEGENLKTDLSGKLEYMLSNVALIEERSPQIMREYKERLYRKVEELLGDVKIDESRIAAEIVIFADKMCTDEETVRLKSHITSMSDSIKEGGSVGRRLDFIAQEMNREANTILSKANDLAVSNIAIELKTEIEKIREQIQNIE